MGLSDLSVPDYILRCSGIKNAVETNVATFATPNPSIATLEAAIQLLAQRQEAIDNNPSPDGTYLRNQAKLGLHPLMVTLATYVSGIANGDGEIILLSGFQLVGDKNSVGLLSPPETLKRQVDGLNTGEIKFSWSGVNRNSGYMVSIAPVEDGGVIGTWTDSKPKGRIHLFKGLISGQLYAMRVATLSAAGQGTWSITVTYRPQ